MVSTASKALFFFLRPTRPLLSLSVQRSFFIPCCAICRTNGELFRRDFVDLQIHKDSRRSFAFTPAAFKTFEEFKRGYEHESSAKRKRFYRGTIFTFCLFGGFVGAFFVIYLTIMHYYYTFGGTGRKMRRDSNIFVRFFAACTGDYTKFAYNTDPDPVVVPAVAIGEK